MKPSSFRLCVSLVVLAVATCIAHAQPENPWSLLSEPSSGLPKAFGGFAHGCIAGAAELPVVGSGYEVVHLERRRFFGHPTTIDFVERLGTRAAAAGLPRVLVGDMAQPRGGPLPYGHESHQTGLDVDIWFTFAPRAGILRAAAGDLALPSMLRPDWRRVDPARFTAMQIMLLHLAASDPAVDRIFVNPVIKETLCRTLPARDHAWLGRLRPWFLHDDHFHVRLGCPADSPACEAQAPVPPGDGCDATLASWVRDQRPPPSARVEPSRPRPMPALPAECRAVLAAPRGISLP